MERCHGICDRAVDERQLRVFVEKKSAYLGQVKRSRVRAVIVVTIHMEDLLALDGEQAREHTLGQASAKNDDLRRVSRVDTGIDMDERLHTSYSSSML